MTVTNDERRKVVARLRDFENLRPTFEDSVLCGFLEALDVGYLNWEGVCTHLANFIEPEPEPERTTPADKLLCRHCGYSIVYQDGDDVYTWDYCPHCGARIVD